MVSLTPAEAVVYPGMRPDAPVSVRGSRMMKALTERQPSPKCFCDAGPGRHERFEAGHR